MYKISEFSKITNLTVKALRYYDDENLLKPSYRGDNSFRYYGEDDYNKAMLIVLLRALDFSISEIRDILQNCDNPDDLSYYLSEKQSMIAEQIKKEKELIEKIDLYLKPKEAEAIRVEYKIDFKEFDAITVSSIRFKGKYGDVGQYFGTIYKEVKGKAAGGPFCCYYEDEFKEEADIEICVPTKGVVTGKHTTSKQLPPIKAICTTHIGSYDTIHLAYKALLDYAKEHGIQCKVPSREIYHKGPGMIFKGNPSKYVTEIAIPIYQEE